MSLSDRQAADAVRSRLDWKYLLCLELDDAGFDHSVLCEFRARLLTGGKESQLLEKLLGLRRLIRRRFDWQAGLGGVGFTSSCLRSNETLAEAWAALQTLPI